jgi:hypothetical protein
LNPWQKGPPQKEDWYSQRPLTHWYRSFGVVIPSAQPQIGPVVTVLNVPSVQQAGQLVVTPSQVTWPGPAGQVWSWFTALQTLPLHETLPLRSPQ